MSRARLPRARRNARRSAARAIGAGLALAAASLAGCSLDWTVRPEEAADASAIDAVGDDVALDAASPDATTDAPEETSTSCAALADDVEAKRIKARECNLGSPGQCTTAVDDACGCKVPVTSASSAATAAYVAAIVALKERCAVDCTAACPQLPPTASWACLAQGSGGIRCVP
ncbi:MAG: hypothetical protein KF782_29335 [Labilithrix sp.]|nr:hypothetical protein [Labilithrix sp.]